jgi:hypothetical protein
MLICLNVGDNIGEWPFFIQREGGTLRFEKNSIDIKNTTYNTVHYNYCNVHIHILL